MNYERGKTVLKWDEKNVEKLRKRNEIILVNTLMKKK